MTDISKNPVITIDMHRSSTSLPAKLLEQCGLFIGIDIDDNNEAIIFHDLNEITFRKFGESWEYPAPIDNLLHNETLRNLHKEYMQALFSSPPNI